MEADAGGATRDQREFLGKHTRKHAPAGGGRIVTAFGRMRP